MKQHDNLLKEEKIADSKEGLYSVVKLNADPDNSRDKTRAINHSENFAEVRLAQVSISFVPSSIVMEPNYMSSLAASVLMPMLVHTVSRAGPTSRWLPFFKVVKPLQIRVFEQVDLLSQSVPMKMALAVC